MDPVDYALAISSCRIPALAWHFGFYMTWPEEGDPLDFWGDPLDFWIAHAVLVTSLRESGVL